VSNADNGSDDLGAGLAEMGLSPRAAWYSSVALYGSGGLVVTGLYTLNPALFPRGIFYLGCSSLVIAAFCLLGGVRLVDSSRIMEWMTHARLVIGLIIYVIAVVILEAKVSAFALVPLLMVTTVCYLYTWRFGLPYLLAAASIVCVGLLLVDGPARVAHTLITTFAFVMIATAALLIKQRAGLLARHNRQLAYTDPLTGIANMRSLRERIAAELGRPTGDGRPFALFAIDLDNFKQVNDRFDHSLGDMVLCAAAAAVSEELGPGDLAVRRGGDEFAVLVAKPAERDLDELRDRLKHAIAQARIATCPDVTPSATVAYVRTRPEKEIGEMMERADQALHDAKVSSRERRRGQEPELAEPVHSVDTQDAAPIGGADQPDYQAATESITHFNSLWRFAAFLFGATAVAIAVVSIGQMVQPLTPVAGGFIAAGLMALALSCRWAGGSRVSEKWLHLPWVAAYALIVLAIALAGRSGTALLDLLPVIVLYGFLIFTARAAALYMLAGLGLYGAFAIGGGFPEGLTRTVITTAVVAIDGGLLVKLRQVTLRFARTNRDLSELDVLTGVANLRALRGRVIDAIERASQQQLHPVVVAIDLDEFKQVNDVHSHSTGDRVLIAVARAVSEHVRIDELVARRGGDEFAIVIDDADPEYADAVVRRIDDAIVMARRRICPDLRPTASITSVPWRPGETPDDFLHQADIALHGKKAEMRLFPHWAGTANDSGGGYDTSTNAISTRNVGAAH